MLKSPVVRLYCWFVSLFCVYFSSSNNLLEKIKVHSLGMMVIVFNIMSCWSCIAVRADLMFDCGFISVISRAVEHCISYCYVGVICKSIVQSSSC